MQKDFTIKNIYITFANIVLYLFYHSAHLSEARTPIIKYAL